MTGQPCPETEAAVPIYECDAPDEWMDHSALYVDERGNFVWCAQPYGLGGSDLAEIAAFAERAGLDVFVDGDSWWYPGSTTMVRFARAGARIPYRVPGSR